MKKISIFLFILLTFLNFPQTAKAETLYFGKIQSEQAYFYNSPNEYSQLFVIPYSYFVQVTDVEDEEFYKATYKDLEGYVLKSDVILMAGQPNTPYYNDTFLNYSAFSLYTTPQTSSTEVTSFSENQSFNYYGAMEGEELKESITTWFYCTTNLNGQTYYGYIYSGIVNEEIRITINTETFDEVSEEVFTATTNGQEFSALSTGTKILLIISIAVPSIFILFFLIKPSKMKKQKVEKKGIRKIQHGDYFEFDDKDL